MGSHGSGIKEHETDIHIAYLLEHEEHSSECPGRYPSDVTGVYRMPFPVFPGKFPPLASGTQGVEHAFEGDPVITTDTGVDLDWYEGPGAMWNIDWDDWTKRSFSLA